MGGRKKEGKSLGAKITMPHKKLTHLVVSTVAQIKAIFVNVIVQAFDNIVVRDSGSLLLHLEQIFWARRLCIRRFGGLIVHGCLDSRLGLRGIKYE